MRLLAIPIAVLLLAGCTSSQPGNPFMRTTVPPPGTGAAITPGAQPYYPAGGTAPPFNGGAPATAPPVQAMPPAAAPAVPPMNKYAPPGGFSFPQSSIDRPKAVSPTTTDLSAGGTALARRPTPAQPTLATVTSPTLATVPGTLAAADAKPLSSAAPAADASVKLASNDSDDNAIPAADGDAKPSIRIVESKSTNDDSGDESAAQTADTRASPTLRLTATEPADAPITDISDLPKTAVQTAAAQSRIAGSGQRATFANYAQRVTPASAPASSPAAAAPGQRYAQSNNYTTLSGRLEYLQSSERWKLRYIPIDGQTDAYGGSVLLDNPTLMAKFKPGDFVTVQGSVSSQATDNRGYSPLYDLQNIQPQ